MHDIDTLAHLIAAAPPRPEHLSLPAAAPPLPATTAPGDHLPEIPQELLDTDARQEFFDLRDAAARIMNTYEADPVFDLGEALAEATDITARKLTAPDGHGDLPPGAARDYLEAVVDAAHTFEAAELHRGRAITERNIDVEIAADLAWRTRWAAAAWRAAKRTYQEQRNERSNA